MDTNLLQQRQKIWGALPEEIRSLLSAEETVELIEKTGDKYKLSEMEQGFLLRITGKLLQGLLPPTEFVKEVERNIDISRENAMYLAQDLNRDIFNNVKDSLKKLYSVGTKPSGAPIGTAPASLSAPVAQQGTHPTAPLLRNDWGWHGTKNETTGQIEFKRESAKPDTATKNAVAEQTSSVGGAHVGSIFEQKLGGTFRLKSEAVQYSGTPLPAQALPQQNSVGQLAKTPTLHVPMKPKEIQAPPVHIVQPPK